MGYYENKQDVYKELARAYLKNRNHHAGGDPNWEPTPEKIKEQRPRFKQLSLNKAELIKPIELLEQLEGNIATA